eukprot:CAMPEP_0206547536 /NCGR_PEP_ID=MMETSP0325_2-20121206/13351_1 /ASSEMBLY_ACC=CAM_ASM_000347 /TAXON_ID=2866 /ORGANISM="Crypthecodinium cohnii, Strain Seligo" /LENGTH=65 /DNA_ID=CAMNT_0054046853 /DNA_START=322 /DNA_END=515 /DNA_ORIENTATION=-
MPGFDFPRPRWPADAVLSASGVGKLLGVLSKKKTKKKMGTTSPPKTVVAPRCSDLGSVHAALESV